MANEVETVPATELSPTSAKPSLLKKVGRVAKKVLPLMNKTTLSIVLSLAVGFGVVAPEKATGIRNDVLEPLSQLAPVIDALVN
ncbi:hypothetical protein [Sphingomonas xinjiangensis]|uniref:Uncharacterized protein n=1 Tax=Sphingomonas xinjiangensis TaxID=643568 RepID=A0A840YPK1_9SPHN|nr:hypothetical protein [Sphingomonas xinjiangensis]MBB5709453.1 hypothetical protein [Sphingomonas xinjiangensis]